MKVKVRLFAVARELAGDNSVELELGEHPTVESMRDALVMRIPGLNPMANLLRFAVNEEYAHDQMLLRDGDEVACIPPVSGG